MTNDSNNELGSDKFGDPGDEDTPIGVPVVVERAGWRDTHKDEVSLISLVNVLLRERWTILLSVGGIVGLALIFTLLQSRPYTAQGSFVPQDDQSGQLSRFAGVAAQFGMNIPSGGTTTRSPQFYADLVRSRWLLSRVAETEVHPPDKSADSGRSTLPVILDIEEPSDAERISETIDVLEDWISVSTNPETGVVRLSVATPWPGISEQVGQRVLELVNEFNVEVRQSQGASERRFVEERLQEVERDLQAAEGELETFLERNRRYQNSPELRFEYQRLQRRVDLRQQVYSSLSQSLEQARIQEVKSTPVITVVDPVERPVRADSSYLVRNTVLALILGGVIGVVLAFLKEFVRSARAEESEEYREFKLLKQETSRELRGWWGRTKRKLLGSS